MYDYIFKAKLSVEYILIRQFLTEYGKLADQYGCT